MASGIMSHISDDSDEGERVFVDQIQPYMFEPLREGYNQGFSYNEDGNDIQVLLNTSHGDECSDDCRRHCLCNGAFTRYFPRITFRISLLTSKIPYLLL